MGTFLNHSSKIPQIFHLLSPVFRISASSERQQPKKHGQSSEWKWKGPKIGTFFPTPAAHGRAFPPSLACLHTFSKVTKEECAKGKCEFCTIDLDSKSAHFLHWPAQKLPDLRAAEKCLFSETNEVLRSHSFMENFERDIFAKLDKFPFKECGIWHFSLRTYDKERLPHGQ